MKNLPDGYLTGHFRLAMLLLIAAGMLTGVTADAMGQATFKRLSGEVLTAGEFIQSGESVAAKDSLALVAYYHSTNGDNWIDNSGWLQDPVPFWIGIRAVDEVNPGEFRVTEVDMPRDNMTIPGPFPPEMQDLEYVWFWKSDVNLHSGAIPREMAKMPRLEELLIRTNVLTGDIPWEDFAQMPTMQEFRVRQNFLSGQMPAMLGGNGEWPVLRRIFLDSNLITGRIPQIHPDLTSLNQIYFHNLRLTGPVPDYSHLQNVEYYRIAGNNLDPGPIPDFILNWAETLERIEFQNTNRTGSLPPWFTSLEALDEFIIGGRMDTIGEGETTMDIPDMSFMPSLRRINFQGGGWTGPIPTWIGQSATIEDVTFIGMNINGPIPGNLADPDRITLIHLRELDITGGIPAQFQLADGLRILRIIDNPNMTIGAIPQFIGNSMTSLTELQLRNSGVTGEIPANLNNLELTIFSVRDNPGITGEGIPQWLSNKRLNVLDLSYTGLNVATLPTWLITQRNMNRLGLSGLGISGTLPPQFGMGLQAVNLRSISLADNNFTGSIPETWGSIQRLDSLNLANNNLSGNIPETLANAGRVTDELNLLQALILSGNADLTGPLPDGFADARFMRVIDLEGTDLCVPDTDRFRNWIEGIPDYANETYPPRHYSVTGIVYCSDVSLEDTEEHVNRLALHQNYPNPFNPGTVISFDVPDNAGNVRLAVYNLLGQRVATLANGPMTPGRHTVNFDGSALASGKYVYRLNVDGQILSKSMTILK